MNEVSNNKSDKEKLNEILDAIGQKDYLLTKDYFELKDELERYFETCSDIINKNSDCLDEANYAAGLIQELLGNNNEAVRYFSEVNDGNKSNESISLYKKSLYRIFLIKGRSFLKNNIQADFNIISDLFKKIETVVRLENERLKNKIDDSFSGILFMMALITNKRFNRADYYKKYLIEIIEGGYEQYNILANHYLGVCLVEDLIESSISNNKTPIENSNIDSYIIKINKYINCIEEYDRSVLNQILRSLNINPCVSKNLLSIYSGISSIKDRLNILKPRNINNYLLYETKVAHYTSPYVAYKLIHDNSRLRLNITSYTNDPTEGLVLGKFLRLNIKDSVSSSMRAFVSCFTFNHDNLNQFRLYGKTNGVEASGLSITFNIDFFNTDQYKDNSVIFNNYENEDPQTKKTRLYKCLYIDPYSSYIYLSRRDEITFYRQYLNIDRRQLNYLWEKYNNSINIIENEIRNYLTNIMSNLNEIEKVFTILDGKQVEYINTVISNILVSLQYLVKHAAFKEEQECRIIQIVEKSKKVKKEIDKKLIYVEYSPEVKNYIDKIYFSPGAKDYKDFFVSKDFHESKLKDSLNPFRNK